MTVNQSLIFQTIAKYSEPQRVFHTMEHLAYLWKQYDRACYLSPHLSRYRERMEWLIPFHDWVYIPGDPLNEESSAKFAEEWLTTVERMNLKDPFSLKELAAREIPRTIRKTKTHTEPENEIEELFFDMDLSGLGDTPRNYEHTSSQIEQEFVPVVGGVEFRTGRKKWLEGMLARPKIYNLSMFHQLEKRARINMETELKSLG